MTEPQSYPDPTTEASGRIAEAVAAFATLGEALARAHAERLRHRAHEDREQAQRIAAEQRQRDRKTYEDAKAVFKKASDPRWLRRADLLDLAQAWKTVGLYADIDPAALAAIEKVEAQLRLMYDGPMKQYDHLRAAGYSRHDAMKPAAAMMAKLEPYAPAWPHGTQIRTQIENTATRTSKPANAAALAAQGFAAPVTEAAIMIDIHPPSRRAQRKLAQTQNRPLAN